MIKIQSNGSSPGWYQIDQSYQLPSVTGAVQWNGTTKCFEVSNGASWMRIDNTVQISNTYDMSMVAQWAMKKMAEEEETKKLRSKYPALDEAYNHLEMIKALVAGPEENSAQTSP
jgi:hypothetical protein